MKNSVIMHIQQFAFPFFLCSFLRIVVRVTAPSLEKVVNTVDSVAKIFSFRL